MLVLLNYFRIGLLGAMAIGMDLMVPAGAAGTAAALLAALAILVTGRQSIVS